MTSRLISGRIQLLHHTEYEWNKIGDKFIPEDGEACLTLDDENLARVKFGDGIKTWSQIDYIDNHVTFDKGSISQIGSKVELTGISSAKVMQIPRKGEDGTLEWYTPIRAVALGDESSTVESDEDGTLIIPKATSSSLGVVKGSDEIGVSEEGSLEVNSISIAKVQGLQSKLDALTIGALSASIDEERLSFEDGVLSIKKVEASKIVYNGDTLDNTIDSLVDSTTWTGFIE